MDLLLSLAQSPPDNRWFREPYQLSRHETALIGAFLENSRPTPAVNCTPLDFAFIHLMPFIRLPEDEALRYLGDYVQWRNRPHAVDIGDLVGAVGEGIRRFALDRTGLKEFFLYSYWVEFWLQSICEQKGWIRLLPADADWQSIHAALSGQARQEE